MAKLRLGDVVRLKDIIEVEIGDGDEEEDFIYLPTKSGIKPVCVLIPRVYGEPVVRSVKDFSSLHFSYGSTLSCKEVDGIKIPVTEIRSINQSCFEIVYREYDSRKLSKTLSQSLENKARSVLNFFGPEENKELYKFVATLFSSVSHTISHECSCGLSTESLHLKLSPVDEIRATKLEKVANELYKESGSDLTVFPYSFICVDSEKEYIILSRNGSPARIFPIDSGWLSQ